MAKIEIKPHFRKAIEEMDGDIQGLQNDIERLTAARSAIVELYGGDTDIPDAPKITKKSVPRAPRSAGTAFRGHRANWSYWRKTKRSRQGTIGRFNKVAGDCAPGTGTVHLPQFAGGERIGRKVRQQFHLSVQGQGLDCGRGKCQRRIQTHSHISGINLNG